MLRFLLVVVVTLSVLASSGSAASCDVRLWVRADDLHPASVAEGDARLVNNLTSVEEDDDCRVASWSLGLRHRERVALKYPLPDVELPAEPKYNSSWDSFRRRIRNVTFIEETVFDPHEEERKEYDRKLEEYAAAMRSHEHWVIVEEERTTFDIMADMGAVEELREGFQVAEDASFAVLVPPVDLAVDAQFNRERIDGRKSNVSYAAEVVMEYYGLVKLVNGTVLELPGGRTTFVPRSNPSPELNKRAIKHTFDSTSKATRALDRGAIRLNTEGQQEPPQEFELPDLGISVSLEGVPALVQGKNHLINGSVTRDNDRYEVQWVTLKLEMRNEATWAQKHLQEGGRDELQMELAEMNRPQRFGTIFGNNEWAQPRVSEPAGKHLAEVLKKKADGDDCTISFPSMWPRWPIDYNVDEDGAFGAWVNVSDLVAPTNRPSAYEVFKADLKIFVAVIDKTAKDGDCQTQPVLNQTRSRAIDADSQNAWFSNQRKGCTVMREPDAMVLEAVVKDIDVLPHRWEVLTREPLDQVECDEIPTVPLSSPDARAPSIVVGKLSSVDRRRPCQCLESFPLLHNLTKVQLRRHNVGGVRDDSLRFSKKRYRQTDKCRALYNLRGLGGIGCHSVGRVWADKVMAPLVKQRKTLAGQTVFAPVRVLGYYQDP